MSRGRWSSPVGALVCLVAACAESSEPAAGSVVPATDRTASSESVADDLARTTEQLAELGYLDFSPRLRDEGGGVIEHDPERSCPGYTLYVAIAFARAILIDATGQEVHRWEGPAGQRWTRVRLLPGGHLLVIGQDMEDPLGPEFLRKLDFEGREVWVVHHGIHHDVEVQADGTLLALTQRDIGIHRAFSRGKPVLDNGLIHLDENGEVLDHFSLLEAVRAAPGILKLNHKYDRGWAAKYVDPLHCNSVFAMKDDRLAAADELFSRQHVMVSSRHQNSILIFHRKTRALVWAWGRGEVRMQHDASVLEGGRVLLFDNGIGRGHSRVVIMDPTTRRVDWSYMAPKREDFFSPSRGTAQALPNGNILVGNSDDGEAFEITPGGDVVWRFLTPLRDEQGHLGVIRVERYPVDMVQDILAAHRQG